MKKKAICFSMVSVSCPKMLPALQHIHLWPGAEGQRQVGFKAALVSPDRFLARKILETKRQIRAFQVDNDGHSRLCQFCFAFRVMLGKEVLKTRRDV